MSQNPGPGTAYDPFAAWKSFYQMNEESWTQMLEQMMGTQAFARAMGQWLDNSLKSQEAAKKNVEASLSAMNFPTKTELTRIAEQIVAVDAKLDDLSFVVEQLGDDLRALKERGPEAVRGELESLTAQVAALTTAVDKLRTAKPASTPKAKATDSSGA